MLLSRSVQAIGTVNTHPYQAPETVRLCGIPGPVQEMYLGKSRSALSASHPALSAMPRRRTRYYNSLYADRKGYAG